MEVGLDRLVANQLDLTRLKSHAIQLQREPQTLKAVAEATLAREGRGTGRLACEPTDVPWHKKYGVIILSVEVPLSAAPPRLSRRSRD